MKEERIEVRGTLYVLGIAVLRGLYATKLAERQTWINRIPRAIRWACKVEWTVTWTNQFEYRDATGELHRQIQMVFISGQSDAIPRETDRRWFCVSADDGNKQEPAPAATWPETKSTVKGVFIDGHYTDLQGDKNGL